VVCFKNKLWNPFGNHQIIEAMKKLWILSLVSLLGCGPDPIPAPEPTLLISPTNLNRCTSTSLVNANERQVAFQWTTSLNTDFYELIIQNATTGEQTKVNTTLLKESVILSNGAPYRWFVLSKSTATEQTAKSSEWQFYLEANPQSSHIPFPALLVEPPQDTFVDIGESGSISLQWEGNDLDDDISTYDLYVGNSETDLDLVDQDLTSTDYTLSVSTATVYFWQIVTIDQEGNQSYSSVFQFTTN
jgi:hypothetical protein